MIWKKVCSVYSVRCGERLWKIFLPIKPRIDYIFHSLDLKCNSASVIIKESAGDHCPVLAVFDPQISQINADYEKQFWILSFGF
jgi:endonuclease/exonuclease/phosphatase family metal-dependent hydrolase